MAVEYETSSSVATIKGVATTSQMATIIIEAQYKKTV